ncbi:hypothetical protein PG996_006726 [Apiospora saccharicola]|uniref:P-loop containing nucleoside triphosphate hydrolase protein n=1 Tax=Apiospora saccharicola TaxID=335842 RepID=A0ABR1V8T7_9PEZI
MAFFDTHGPGEISTRIMSDMNLVREGITSKASIALTAVATFAAAFIINFMMYWKTALVLSPTFVVMVAIGSFGGAYVVRQHKRAMALSSQASSLAEEAIASMRLVSAFGIQEHIAAKYFSCLTSAGRPDIRSRNVIAGMIAWSNAVPSLVYALTFWAGSIFLVRDEVSVAALTTTALAVTIGAFAIVRVAPAAQALSSTVASAGVVLEEIARRSPQDPFASLGDCSATIKGDVEFRGVSLIYPSRDNRTVLHKVSFACPAMKTTAIVGASGSGKSSIVGLMERFYEPTAGEVCLDGKDIQSLNLSWLRGHMALVGQEPRLFDTTIFENIEYGEVGCREKAMQENPNEIRERVMSAARKANAHDFITALPEGYQTQVGQKGFQLSGGQRQRIAIVRALIRNPSILLLDEATSALDSKSEATVQAAIEEAARQRTTIIIAHRLSTIRHADNIIVMSEGRVTEQSTHDDLVVRDGHYASLVRSQQIDPGFSNDKLANHDDSHEETEEVEEVHGHGNDNLVEDLTGKQSRDLDGILNRLSNGSADASNLEKKIEKLGLARTLAFIIKHNSKEYPILIVGLCCSIIAGLAISGKSILFAKVLETLSLAPSRYHQLRDDIDLYAGLFLMLAGVAFLSWLGAGVAFAHSTEKLSRRLRDRCFRSIMSQDVGFFDKKEHSTGSLLSILSSSTEELTSLGGPVIGGTLTFTSTILGGIILSPAIGWKLALVYTATIPLILRLQILTVFDAKTRQNGRDSASYTSELVKSVETIASLNLEEFVLDKYNEFLAQQSAQSLRSIHSASGLYAASQSIIYLYAALAFYEYSLFQFYICFSALISGSQIAGSIFTFAPDASKAMHAGWEVQGILERKPRISSNHNGDDPDGDLSGPSVEHGTIEFKNVSFRYPSRPERLALDDFSLKVEPGQSVALVGGSGSGKSTVFALVERFYDPNRGSVLAGGHDISKLHLGRYRQIISLVSQEAVLYSGSIRENIALGIPDQTVPDEAIWAACKQANIHDFVASLQDGLSTLIGPSGSMLSGGQKQRIAIARALLRQPNILLLDEAMSALDTECERLVQAALEAAAKDKTTLTIAHRLSTVRKADRIYVLSQGTLVESGTHEELLAKKGKYWEFVNMQNLH